MANEKRLIDANALMDTVEGVNWYHIDKLGYLASGANSQDHTPIYKAEDIYNAIRNAPTVDAVEVVHGRWVCTYDENTGETEVTCSHCKDTRNINGCYVTSTGESCYFEDNYCPNCGAKMDGGNGNCR